MISAASSADLIAYKNRRLSEGGAERIERQRSFTLSNTSSFEKPQKTRSVRFSERGEEMVNNLFFISFFFYTIFFC